MPEEKEQRTIQKMIDGTLYNIEMEEKTRTPVEEQIDPIVKKIMKVTVDCQTEEADAQETATAIKEKLSVDGHLSGN